MRPGMMSRLARVAVIGLIATSGPRWAMGAGGLPDARLGIRTAPLLLLSRPDVRADLRLDPELAAAADRFIGDLHDRAQTLRGRNDAEAVAARGEIDNQSRRWLEASLTPAQRARLDQIELQWQGPSALIRPIVADSLALTDDQRKALAQAIVARNARRKGGPPDLADEARLTETALGLLDAVQRDRWHAMLGTPLPFAVATRPAAPAQAPARR